MLFNSIDFAVFIPIVFVLYWLLSNKNIRLQNLLLVIASYVFYGWWDWRFLSLIFFSTVVDYTIGLKLNTATSLNHKKLLLWSSVFVNIGLLGFFKYYNFFIDNFTAAFSFLGMPVSKQSLNIILPVGISFYTFQTLSYTIDVYKEKLTPTKDFISFTAFVSFFPQLVAGPIERASHLLPQFYTKRNFNYDKAVDGLRQILWGLFKKVVVADNAAKIANEIFNNSESYSGSTLVVGAIFFSFQIYCDFSGYSDIAIGTSRLFGFKLKQNFAYPYFSRDIAEFWRRWHISLSTWFRDYVYIPLGGSRVRFTLQLRNIFIIFIVSGFWHGANWTFIVWGALNAFYFLPLLITQKNRVHTLTIAQGQAFPSLKQLCQITITFMLTVFAWIFFRAENMQHAWSIITTIFSTSLFTVPYAFRVGLTTIIETSFFILVLLVIEWMGRHKKYALEFNKETSSKYQWALFYGMALVIFLFGQRQQDFIYFQF